jgi:superfamily II DNA or RNA helicase
MKLRDYQIRAKDLVVEAWKENNSVLLCMPTGAGKTVVFSYMAQQAVNSGYKVLIVTDRKELLNQANNKLFNYGLNASLITAGRRHKTSNCYVATIQTLMRRSIPLVDIVIIDECHKQIFDKLFEVPDFKVNNCFFLGVTATPKRSGRMNQLVNIYQEIIEPVTIVDLISNDFLVPAISYGAEKDMSDVKMKGQDYDVDDLYSKFNKSVIYKDLVDKYNKFTPNTKAICFNINVQHSKNVAAEFRENGIAAEHIDGSTPKSSRELILSQFDKGIIQVLCNCEVLTAGFDQWDIETVIINRATKSLSLFLQMAGRGSRPTDYRFIGKEGYLQKTHFNILDMGSNIFTHGFWEDDRSWSLIHKTSKKEGVAPVKECKEIEGGCGAIVHSSAPKCKYCGHVFPKKEMIFEEGDFIQLENVSYTPAHLIDKKWSDMNIQELDELREAKKYKLGWVIQQIKSREDLSLSEYAELKGYKRGWVNKMKKMYSID